MSSKIWKIRGKEEKVSDEDLIFMISHNELSEDDYISTNDMKKWMKIKDTIYQFYLGGKNETL